MVVDVPNKGVLVGGNGTVVVTGGLIMVFSLVVIGAVPNPENVVAVVDGAVVVTTDGIEKVLSLVVVAGVYSSTIVSGILLVGTAGVDAGVDSSAGKRDRKKNNVFVLKKIVNN